MNVKASRQKSKEEATRARVDGQRSPSRLRSRSTGPAASLLNLQRSHGNRFVGGLIEQEKRKGEVNKRTSEQAPNWLEASDDHGSSNYDATFSWSLSTNLPCPCNELYWEQFISGGFTLDDPNGITHTYYACDFLRHPQQGNPQMRLFGEWCDDILKGMSPGPKPVGNYANARCSSEYTFEDEPGFHNNFGTVINGLIFEGIQWHTGFEHKLYCAGQEEPVDVKKFFLEGKNRANGVDTRKIRETPSAPIPGSSASRGTTPSVLKLQRSVDNRGVQQLANGPTLQRKCECAGSSGGSCSQCEEEKKGTLQRHATSTTEIAAIPPIVHDVLRSPGRPLDEATRAFMESRFGYDFGGVRIHTDPKAASSATAVNALAYTVGSNVVFGRGRYAPGTTNGNRLLAHELTHVIQQSQLQSGSSAIVPVSDPSEREAARVSDAVLDSTHNTIGTVSVYPTQLARTPGPKDWHETLSVLSVYLKMVELLSMLSPEVRETVTCRKTVAIGLVVERGTSNYKYVYTSVDNFAASGESKAAMEVATIAKELDLDVWAPTKVSHDAKISAAHHAEQTMIRGAGDKYRIVAMAVSREVCPQCAPVIASLEESNEPVVGYFGCIRKNDSPPQQDKEEAAKSRRAPRLKEPAKEFLKDDVKAALLKIGIGVLLADILLVPVLAALAPLAVVGLAAVLVTLALILGSIELARRLWDELRKTREETVTRPEREAEKKTKTEAERKPTDFKPPPVPEPFTDKPVVPTPQATKGAHPIAISVHLRFNQNEPHTDWPAGRETMQRSLIGGQEIVWNSLIRLMKANPTTKVQLVGRTSPEGTEKHNFDLGKRRAVLVANELLREGIDRSRIVDVAPECTGIAEGIYTCGEVEAFGPADREVKILIRS